MKIGVVTFFKKQNYGAMLQANALRRCLESMGYQVVFILHPSVMSRHLPLWRVFVSRHIKGVTTKLKNYVQCSITDFVAAFPQTKLCATIDDVRHATVDCDAFIVGSDQMWNPMWCSGAHLPLVMLDFALEGKPRIAYAVSFGTQIWRDDQNAKLAGDLLRKFSKISVREESGVMLANTLSGRTDAIQLPDPTLLHSADYYRMIIAEAHVKIPKHQHRTVFKYVLDEWDNEEASQMAFELVKEKLNLVETDSDRILVQGLLAPLCKILGVTAKVAVPEWIAKIAASDFVFTNSFHGTVFALLFHKPFLTVLIKGQMSGMNERILSLLEQFDLKSRCVYAEQIDQVIGDLTTEIDWDGIDRVRALNANKALKFLKEALPEI